MTLQKDFVSLNSVGLSLAKISAVLVLLLIELTNGLRPFAENLGKLSFKNLKNLGQEFIHSSIRKHFSFLVFSGLAHFSFST